MANRPSEHILPLQPASEDIWDKKYRLKDKKGVPLDRTIDDTYRRVARALADVEKTPEQRAKWYGEFLKALQNGAIPAGRITSNAGAQEHKPETSLINCLAGDTPVLTRQGVRPIAELVGGPVEVLNRLGKWVPVQFQSYGYRRTVEASFRNAARKGDSVLKVRSTLNHRWILQEGQVITTEYWASREKIARGHATVPNVFAPRPERNEEYDRGVFHGLVYGDGSRHADTPHYVLDLVDEKQELALWAEKQLGKPGLLTFYSQDHEKGPQGLRWNFTDHHTDWKQLPGSEASPSYVLGFIAGLLATDGSVSRLALGSCNVTVFGRPEVTDYVARMAPTVGIVAYEPSLFSSKGSVNSYGERRVDLCRVALNAASLDSQDVLRSQHKAAFAPTDYGRATVSKWEMVGLTPNSEREEEVFCCQEPETGSFVLASGLLTGNCTVSAHIRDSMDDILEKVHEAGLTLKAGCGIGYSFSTLRPKGAFVAGAGAYTSGPMSFMDIYDKTCFTVASAGGRRGAQMGTFDVSHPDVRDFIRAKREDGRLRQFNLSLLITDDFMTAVESNQEWALVFPVHRKEAGDVDLNDANQIVWREWPITEGYITREIDGKVACKIYDRINARRLWDMIMTSTYDFAEPGFILIDRVNEMNNNWWCENIQATNPCVTADTWVQTSKGPRQVSDLLGAPFYARVDGVDHATGAEGFFRTATKEVVRLQTAEGPSLRLTHDHQVRRVTRQTRWSTETEWCEAGKLAAGDRVLLNNHRTAGEWQGERSYEEGFLLGMLVGDGTLKRDAAVLSVWSQAAAVNAGGAAPVALMDEALRCAQALPHRADFAGWMEVEGRGEHRLKLAALRDLAFDLGMAPGNKSITPAVEKTSSEFHRGFLRGVFDADGSVQGSQVKGVSVRLAQSDLPRLEAVQRMLQRLGIVSTIYRDRREEGVGLLPDGRGGQREYATRAQHELVISGDNMVEFATRVGFADTAKANRLKAALSGYRRQLNRERFVATVESIVSDGCEDVFDVQVPGINTFDANGLHAHNCGEQPLPEYGSCLLGSINLTRFVRNPFQSNAFFDWEAYAEVVRVFTRMLDNVVELNGLPLPRQREEITTKRRHGMGFLGLGSALTMLGESYGNPKSVEFTEQVSKVMAIEGWKVGLELAKEKGAAPLLEREFDVTREMLSKRPEMARDGWKVGQKIRGSVLHARYSRYMQRIAEVEPELVKELEVVGARFTHHSSIAPTGTISLSLANNASNGIEPSFAHHYSRNVIREGKKSKEKVEVYSYELLAYRELVNPKAMPFSDDPETQLPAYFIAADDVTPNQHVDIQAASQKWIDSSISKTANVPTDFPYEKFKDIYLYAYHKGLKGCTTFRFNPAAFQGVLVKEKDLENTIYQFTLDDGSKVEFRGNEEVEYDGEKHTAANLFDALKEGYYGKF